MKKLVMLGLLALVPALALKSSAATQNIVQIAAGNPDFSTLVAALTAADLVKTLEGDGPFTVFAPTNKAFAKIKKADLDALLADKAPTLNANVRQRAARALHAAGIDVIEGDRAVAIQTGSVQIGRASCRERV